MRENSLSRPPTISARTLFLGALAATLVPLLFAFYTGETWEDYYITLHSSRNLDEGHGFVHQIVERVHTFTSLLGVLSALGFKLTGSDVGTLWFLRELGALRSGSRWCWACSDEVRRLLDQRHGDRLPRLFIALPGRN
ncbi:MAG: hypothetical protein WDM96_12655 [Lacunisphaera sp.]